MRIFKKSKVIFLALAMVLSMSSVAYAFTGANDVKFGSGLVNSIAAEFYANRNTGSSPSWGALPYKHIKQSHVRLIEGSYDSGRVYSPLASSTSDGVMKRAYASKTDNPLQTAYTYYGWLYF